MRAETFRWKCCCLARHAVLPLWLRRSTARARRATNSARKPQASGRRCGNSKYCPPAGHRSATGDTSSNSGAEVSAKIVLAGPVSWSKAKPFTPEDTSGGNRGFDKRLTSDLVLSQYGAVRHVARGHNGIFTAH